MRKFTRFYGFLLVSLASLCAFAGDFDLDQLPPFDSNFDLADYSGSKTFYQFMDEKLKHKMKGRKQAKRNDDLLRAGTGVAVKLNENNYNIHVNYDDTTGSGRSYGWTNGHVGDWTDQTYLDKVSKVAQESDEVVKNFYKTLIQMVGGCDTSSLSLLSGTPEQVATTFLAIYGAEEYRATVAEDHSSSIGKNWDDALLEASMLAAFHAGQKSFKLFYMGKLTHRTFEQAPGIYSQRGNPSVAPDASTEKDADLTDYWQKSADPNKLNSGINETRADFEKMGAAITEFEKDQANIDEIEAIVDGSKKNVFKDITQYFVTGKAAASNASALADLVGKFLVKVRNDANEITDSI